MRPRRVVGECLADAPLWSAYQMSVRLSPAEGGRARWGHAAEAAVETRPSWPSWPWRAAVRLRRRAGRRITCSSCDAGLGEGQAGRRQSRVGSRDRGSRAATGRAAEWWWERDGRSASGMVRASGRVHAAGVTMQAWRRCSLCQGVPGGGWELVAALAWLCWRRWSEQIQRAMDDPHPSCAMEAACADAATRRLADVLLLDGPWCSFADVSVVRCWRVVAVWTSEERHEQAVSTWWMCTSTSEEGVRGRRAEDARAGRQ